MSEPRTIKKYPNRRLYDTADSRYITLEDIKRLVREGVEFRVMDARSEEDLTRNILLQVISDQEERGEPILSAELLQQIIRFYGDTMQGLITNYLENSLRAFVERMTRINKGRALYTRPDHLGEYLLVDYIGKKRKKV